MSFGLLGKKLGQTRVYDAQGVLHSVTIVLAGPNRVLQCKTKATDGYDAVQLGFGEQKDQRLSKAKLGHLKKFGVDTKRAGEKTPAVLTGVQRIREFRNFSKPVKTGDLIGPGLFAVGDFVDAIGITKGRGFAGVVRRHDFRGGDSTHGAKGWHRRPGGIGQSATPGTVRRGARLPGHMGSVRRTVQNLEIIQVREADNLLLIKGAIPGANGDYVIIRESKKIPQGTVKRQPVVEKKSKGPNVVLKKK
ncbi:MAG: 50S ribosomal protein L3 [Verrucomicrobia bacterium]|jgi:large subunit ribosomal protein L3|nr:50S ribosomal protein L3 [Verrucomicrobiota bacterium]